MAGTRSTAGMRSSRALRRSREASRPIGANRPGPAVAAVPAVAAIRGSRALFVAAIALSSVSMFSLELLSGDLVLPVFGGAPGVWATALCFFTAILFLGYGYAHLLASRLSPRTAGAVHVGLAVLAVALTIAAPGQVASLRVRGMAEALNVLLALLLIAGPAAFLFSATTPLLSSWYGREGDDPWWLYAASNAASLLGVLAYPFLIQPFIPLSLQRGLLVVAMLLFGLALVAIVLRLRGGTTTVTETAGADRPTDLRRVPTAPMSTAATTTGQATEHATDHAADAADAADARPSRRRQLRWLAAAFVPAGLLSALTTEITTDLVSAPLIWVWPLAIYLGSFVVAFSDIGRRRLLAIVERLVPAAATLLWLPTLVPTSWPVLVVLFVQLTSFSVIAIAVHGRLALDRPTERHLTRFYLIESGGGVLATAFVALVAPQIFTDITEYPLLIIAAMAVLAMLRGPAMPAVRSGVRGYVVDAAIRLAPYVAIGSLFILLSLWDKEFILDVVLLVAVGGVVIAVSRRLVIFTVASAAALVAMSFVLATGSLFEERDFFGVLRLYSEDGGVARSEYSGTTQHGIQFIDARQFAPTSYYVASGPMGDVFADLRQRVIDPTIGIVGLGIGGLTAYDQPGDDWTYYEIDPAVVSIAENQHWFTYLSSAPQPPKIVVGDARLSLQDVPDDTYDLLVLDAFSSDAVPVHLLTAEAMQMYKRVLKPGGVIAFNVSNRYYNLAPALISTANSVGMQGRQLAYFPGASNTELYAATSSDWVVIGGPDVALRFTGRQWGAPRPGPVLTDDFSDLLQLLGSDL